MTSAAVLLALATIGVDLGWHRLATSRGGEIEWIIQIEPERFATLLNQDGDVRGVIPSQYQGARRFRVVVGSGPVLRQGTPPAATDAGELRPLAPPPTRIVTYPVLGDRIDSRVRLLRPLPREPELLHGPALGSPGNAGAGSAEVRRISADEENTPDDPGPSGDPKPTRKTASSASGSKGPTNSAWGWTVFGLLASLASNAYLGWINWGQRERLHNLIDRFRLQGTRADKRRPPSRVEIVEPEDEVEYDDDR